MRLRGFYFFNSVLQTRIRLRFGSECGWEGDPSPLLIRRRFALRSKPGGNVCVYEGGGGGSVQGKNNLLSFLIFLSSLRSQNILFLTYLYNGFYFILMFITTA